MVDRRREEEGGELRKINISASVGAVVDGFEVENLEVYAVHGDVENVTVVPEGAQFEIHAKCLIKNTQAGANPFTTATTVMNATDNVPVGSKSTGTRFGSFQFELHDKVHYIMPDHEVFFRVRVWGNQEAFADVPPEEHW